MDMIMLDIGNLPAKEGDEVIIFNSKPTLEEFSKYCNTIPYEVLTSISRRVKRVYVKD
jgi:alanine racemase